ncbi:sigma-70 family RNA polymerase sigma factor [Mucilaginibacter conchicola]|uniref:Sigma-70 family RNA polymerase sigma factor n=1 Tax=Mucilaginibacter conchicola TaxID=2303333 RepID=A0A372NXP9_9SPHI|nr:sigma-70 family RNA polymerase sigma factor [Mucilaginibacter conchicola]RFZ94886.1 sigma-70 family RNA polymerase sigma factor [Mucilaginibacter conchicola]
MITQQISDTELLLLIKENDHSAFDLLFDRYWERLYRAALARVDDDSVAQDIVQELFIKLWERRNKLAIQLSLENYLLSAVRFSVISHFRSKNVNEVRLDDALQRVHLLEASINENAGYFELEKTLEDALSKMPDMLQKVYELRSANKPVKEIAGELGVAEQTVKNYISEVLRRLRIAIVDKHPEKQVTYLALIIAILNK